MGKDERFILWSPAPKADGTVGRGAGRDGRVPVFAGGGEEDVTAGVLGCIVRWMAETDSATGFGALYERHSRSVYRFALALTGNVAQAEDLTAEAFLRILEAGERVETLTVRAYLVTIVRNLSRNEWKRERRRVAMPAEVAAAGADPAVRMELEAVLGALQGLAAGDREVLLMRAEADLSYEEIAMLTGGTAQAARVRAHRARKRLMEALCRKT